MGTVFRNVGYKTIDVVGLVLERHFRPCVNVQCTTVLEIGKHLRSYLKKTFRHWQTYAIGAVRLK